jgi:hypothetical protein
VVIHNEGQGVRRRRREEWLHSHRSSLDRNRSPPARSLETIALIVSLSKVASETGDEADANRYPEFVAPLIAARAGRGEMRKAGATSASMCPPRSAGMCCDRG